MHRPIGWFLVFSCVLALPLMAQEEDIFAEGAFDAAVASGQASENVNKLIWLGGVNVVSTTNLVVPQGLDAYASQSQVAGKGFLKATNPAVGSLFLSYNFTHWFWASTNSPTLSQGYAQAQIDPTGPKFRLGELHLSFDWDKRVFVRLGNQLIDWGASAVWSPADFINRKSADPNSAIDGRSGKPGIRVHIPWNGGNVFFFADASRSLNPNGTARDLVETGSMGVKVDATIAGWNLGVIGNGGKTSDPRLGFTASGALAGVDLWGELGSTLPFQNRQFGWAASLGGERSWGDGSEWTIRAEGFYNPQGHEDTILTGAVLAGDYTPYYWGRLYWYGELSKKKLWGPYLAGSVSSLSNLSDHSSTTTVSLKTNFPGTLPITFFTQYAGGEPFRELTLTTGGPGWTWGLRSVLEF